MLVESVEKYIEAAVGELVDFDRADIDFEERECVVLGKEDQERIVYFDA